MLSDKKKAQLREGRQFEESGWVDDSREDPRVNIGDGILIKDSKWGDTYWFGVVHKIDKMWKYVCTTGMFGCTGHVLQSYEANSIGKDTIGIIVPNVRDMSEITQQSLFADFKLIFGGDTNDILDITNYPIDEEIKKARIAAEKAKRKSRKKSQ